MDLNETDFRKKPLLHRIPRYVWVCMLVMAAVQMLVFYGSHLLLAGRIPHDLSLALDHRIPVVPAWVLIYFLAFPFWVGSILWILSEERSRAYRFAGAYVIAILTAGVIFVLYPATIQRPAITDNDLFSLLLRHLYWIDTPQNIFPSLHVVTCYFCWRGTMENRSIPAWYVWFAFLFLILTCFCILFVKQHVLVDIPAGIVVAELSMQLARLTRVERVFYAAEERNPIHKE